MAFRGVLQLSGVWLNSQAAPDGGFIGVNELSGVWPSIAAGVSGFIGVHQLSGVWITGYAEEIEADTHTPGYYGVDGLQLKRKKEEDEALLVIMAMYETGIF